MRRNIHFFVSFENAKGSMLIGTNENFLATFEEILRNSSVACR